MEIPENTKQEAIKRLTDRYLFRGFSKEKKRWFFGSLTAIMLPSERFSTTIIYQDETKTYVQIDVDPESVGMYINLKDRKENKIFENDIVNAYDIQSGLPIRVGIIKEIDGCFCFVYGTTPIKIPLINLYTKFLEVIGNKYQNPELYAAQ